jgi:MFS family permease
MTETTLGITLPRTRVLSDRNMRWYLGGQLVSLTGTMLQTAVLTLLIVRITSKEQAGTWTGVVWALGLVPGTFFAPFAGILLDRWDKRRVLIATGIIGILQALVLAYLTYTNQITLWGINSLALLMGFVNAIDGPGRNVIVKDAVSDKRNVRQASKMFTSLYNLAQVAGPGFAGYLVVHFGYPFTFLLNAFSFLVLIVALANMRLAMKAPQSEGEIPAKVWKQVLDGGKYTFSEPGIRLCILLTTGVCIFGFSYYILLAVINKYMLGGDEIGYSHLAGANGIGSFVGAFITIVFGEKIAHKLLVVTGMVVTGICLLLLSKTSDPYFAIGCVFLAGTGFMISFSTLRSSIVHIAEEKVAGVVLGFAFTFFYGGMMICSFTIGPLADHFGSPRVLAIAGVVLLVMATLTPLLPGINELE